MWRGVDYLLLLLLFFFFSSVPLLGHHCLCQRIRMKAESTCIVDIRSEEAYRQGHPPGAFHFPWSEIQKLSCGLPDRDSCIQVVVDSDPLDSQQHEAVEKFFKRFKYSAVEVRDIKSYILLTQVIPQGFCFKPNSYLQQKIDSVESTFGGGVAVDVGCGSGRDLVYLAQRGWIVFGIENRRRLLTCAKALAAKHGVLHRVTGILWDVRKGSGIFRPHSFHLLHCCRFIHRASFPVWLKGLVPGGFVVYSHFLEGCENTRVGHPKNSSGFFFRGELEAVLEASGIVIISKEETLLHDGRPIIHVFGRKKEI